jgi:hypothetical protein
MAGTGSRDQIRDLFKTMNARRAGRPHSGEPANSGEMRMPSAQASAGWPPERDARNLQRAPRGPVPAEGAPCVRR